MSAFLYIAARNDGVEGARRVDLANIAGLFAEPDQPRKGRRDRRPLRIAIAVLVWLIAIGEMVLVTQPETLASCAAVGQPAATRLVRTL